MRCGIRRWMQSGRTVYGHSQERHQCHRTVGATGILFAVLCYGAEGALGLSLG